MSYQHPSGITLSSVGDEAIGASGDDAAESLAYFAATCETVNGRTWMESLARSLNRWAERSGKTERFAFDGRRIVTMRIVG